MMLIDVLISLVFIYMTGAIFCSFLMEAIAARSRSRARMLQEELLSMLGEEDAQKLLGHPQVSNMFELHDRPPSYLPASVFARALLDGLRAPVEWPKPLTGEDVEAGLQHVRYLPLRDCLASLYGASGGDVAVFEKRIGEWFDQSMCRMTGWYRRRTQYGLLVTAFVVVVTFNLDTFHMARTLWTNSAIREVLSAQAVNAAKSDVNQASFENARDTLERLPFGWGPEEAKPTSASSRLSFAGCFVQLAGWLVSAIAISLGAPFWFDLLKRFVDIRATGIRIDAKPTGDGVGK